MAALLVTAGLEQNLSAATAGEDAAPAASGAPAAAAQALFDQGRALVIHGRAREACPKFEESQRLESGLGTQLNLADCYERLGWLASAYALFTKVAVAAGESGQEQREEVARARAAAVESRLTKLTIVVPEGWSAELHVERDGVAVGRSQWGFPVPVDPGLHHVRAWGPGLLDWVSDVTVPSDGGVHTMTVPVKEERTFFGPSHRKLGLAAAGAGAVGIAVGSFFGARAIVKRNEASRAGCDGRLCYSNESAELRDQARSAGDIATVAMGIGAAGLATAAVLFWVVSESGPESKVARLDVCPMAGARSRGLSLRGWF